MVTQPDLKIVSLFRISAQILCLGVFFIAVIVLIGWQFDIETFKRILPGLVTMNPMTAVCFILCAVSLWLLVAYQMNRTARRIAHILAGICLLFNLMRLVWIALGWQCGIDHLLFHNSIHIDMVYHSTIAPTTALSFILIGMALLLIDVKLKGHYISQWFIFAVVFIGLLTILGYMFGVKNFTGFTGYVPMALHTAFAFILLAIGILFARPNYGVMTIIASDSAAGILSRRLILPIILTPMLLSWLQLTGSNAGLFSAEVGAAIRVIIVITILMSLFYISVKVIIRVDTQRKQANELLIASEEKFRDFFEESPIGKSMTNLEGKLTVNKAFCEITGYSKEELSSLKWQQITHPDDIENDQKIINSIISGERKFEHWEKRYIHKSGTIVWIDIYTKLQKDKAGKPLYLITIINNITARKQAEVYGEMGREILQILNDSGDEQDTIKGVLSILKTRTELDAVGIRLQDGDDFPYFTQEGFSKDFLLTENTLIDRAADGDVCRDKNGNVCLQCTCGMVISGKNQMTNPFLTPGGSFWTNNSFPILDIPPGEDPRIHPRNKCIHLNYASVALIPIKNKDRNVGLIQLNDRRKGCFSINTVEQLEGIASHIGMALMRKRAEFEINKLNDELKNNVVQLEYANKELDAFSYSVSHDLRAPLRAIDGFSRMILEDYSNKLDAEGLRYLNVIRTNTQNMARLIDDLLAFSRLGKKAMSISKINMNELSKNIFEELKVINTGRNIQCNIKSLLDAHADPPLIREVLANLISNAIKFTKNKDVAVIEISGRQEGPENIYCVKDNGAGFDMQYANKLFGVFQRLHRADEFEGTGVGLALVQRIVHRHGGRVWAESKIGEGASFYFSLPIKQ